MEIVLVTQDYCGWCDDAHHILERIARDHPVRVRTVNLATAEGQAMAERGGILFPPGVFVDAEPFSYGRVSERKLRRELERRLRQGV